MSYPALKCCSVKGLKNVSAFAVALFLTCCALASPPAEEVPGVAWTLSSEEQRVHLQLPLTEFRSGNAWRHNMMVALDHMSQKHGHPFYYLEINIYCPDARTLLKTASLSEFPVGGGGLFAISLPDLESGCRRINQNQSLPVTLMLVLTDSHYPVKISGNIHLKSIAVPTKADRK